MRPNTVRMTLVALAVGTAAGAFAQSMPTSQPKFIAIYRETIKTGRAAEHARWESGWPAAFERAKSKYNYMAISSITGPQEVWYLSPFADQAAYGQMLAEENDPALGAELERLSRGDAEFVEDLTQLQLVAMPELSHGAFPELAKVRFYEITTFRVRPGYYNAWVAATKAYSSAATRSAPNASWRTYAVVAGAPGGSYLVFSSVGAFSEFDAMAAADDATWKNMTKEETAALQSFSKDGLMSTETQRFRVEPGMSYVDAATKAKDPEFWSKRP